MNIWEALESSPPGGREEADGESTPDLQSLQGLPASGALSANYSLNLSRQREERQLQVDGG